MNLFKYESYDHYVESQAKKTRRKFHKVWVKHGVIEFVCDIVKKRIPEPKFGICHGVRNGAEVKIFNELLPCNVIGTELVHVKDVENVIIHDFHETKNEWINNVDFIYSNAFDHSYDPEMCIKKWMSCIKKDGGLCFIEWAKNDKISNEIDCFGAGRKEYESLLSKNFDVEVIPVSNKRKMTMFVVKHRNNE